MFSRTTAFVSIGTIVTLALLVFGPLSTGTAMAVVTYEFYGTIDTVSGGGDVLADLSLGDSFAYGLVVDENVPDSDTRETIGSYNDAILEMYLDINGRRFLEAEGGRISIADNLPYFDLYDDVFQPYIDEASYFTTDLGEWAAASSQVNLWQRMSGEATAFDSDALPLFEIDPALFNHLSGFNVHLDGPLDPYGYPEHGYLHGNITASAFIPEAPPWGTPASVTMVEYKGSSDISSSLFFMCVPVGVVLLWKGLRRRR